MKKKKSKIVYVCDDGTWEIIWEGTVDDKVCYTKLVDKVYKRRTRAVQRNRKKLPKRKPVRKHTRKKPRDV